MDVHIDLVRIAYLDCSALIWERAAEEDSDDVHERVRHVVLQRDVGVLPVVRCVRDDGHVEKEAPLEELPHVVRGIDLFHLDLGVDVAVGQEVDVGIFHLLKRNR